MSERDPYRGGSWRLACLVSLVLALSAALGTASCKCSEDVPEPGISSAPSAAPPPPTTASAAPAPAPEPEWTAEDDVEPPTIPEQRDAMFRRMQKFLGLSDQTLAEVRRIFETQRWMGQGNPKCTEHPMTRAECLKIRATAELVPGDEARCGAKNMVPIYNRTAGETERDATVCIDQYEFPNIPCDYPVTWVPANVAQELCLAQGKRMCDAHEWEGACAGAVLPAEDEYAWYARKGEKVNERRLAIEHLHNKNRDIVWSYGPEKDHTKCATGSRKSDGCIAPTWEKCGTNTYPAGAFPACVSPFGAYDLHGNAAEHMNLPMSAEELASRGTKLGQTEMKGSWFIFTRYEAHIDDCRWRAPSWHGGPVMARGSHMNYHLGFRCCRDLPPRGLEAKGSPDAAPGTVNPGGPAPGGDDAGMGGANEARAAASVSP